MNFLKPLFDLINQFVFSPVLKFFTEISGGSFAAGIFLFTLVINILLIPLSIKSQKASVQQIKIKAKLDDLKKRCGDDKQKYQQGMQKIYTEENVSMGGGCLPMMIRLLLIMSVYYLVISPITYLAPDIKPETISAASVAAGIDEDNKASAYRAELIIVEKALDSETTDESLLAVREGISDIKFELFGKIDLTKTPKFELNFSKVSKEQFLLWLIPIASFVAAMFSSVLSMAQQKKVNPGAPNMAGMLLTMPIISLVIAFSAPAGLGFYWACSSLIGALVQAGLQEFYGPHKMVAKEQGKLILSAYEKEQKIKKAKADNE